MTSYSYFLRSSSSYLIVFCRYFVAFFYAYRVICFSLASLWLKTIDFDLDVRDDFAEFLDIPDLADEADLLDLAVI